MYKLLLCWRYLRTRYLALACITSVMLGVATLIVVNSVMSGFSTLLRHRLHDLCSDVLIEATSLDGFADPAGKMALIRQDPELAAKILAMTPTLEVFAIMEFNVSDGLRTEKISRPVRLIGVDPEGRSAIGGFSNFLVKQKGLDKPSFTVTGDALMRFQWRMHQLDMQANKHAQLEVANNPPVAPVPATPFQPHGAIIGNLLASFRQKDEEKPGEFREIHVIEPGDQVVLYTISGNIGVKSEPVYDGFVVVDFFKSEMSEYDSNCVFVPLDRLQHLRTMQDRVTSIQIRLHDSSEAKHVVDQLHKIFPESASLHIVTWEEKQGPILAAIAVERGILNVLLFLIIGVAGFGILAIFSMIVAEKTRDIGILKALGASNYGVMKIFLGYGFLLGVIGTLCGTGAGLGLATHINEVEQWLSQMTGQAIFPRDVYYFNKIPTDIQLWTLVIINAGAVGIAVVFSVLPALRAAMLHPVRALRYE